MKFVIDIAQDIRAYGTVEVEADDMAAAIALVDKGFVIENFAPHGSGADDYDHSDPRSVWLGEINDEDGEYIDMADVELTDDEKPMTIWTLTLNAESGIETEVHPTEEAADTAAINWAADHWKEFEPTKEMPTDLGEIMDALDEAGFIDTVHITRHDRVTKQLNNQSPRPFTPLVMMHAFTKLPDGSTEHCEDGVEPSGWNVWLRRDFIGADPATEETFDDDEGRNKDFPPWNKMGATAYARALATELDCEIEEY